MLNSCSVHYALGSTSLGSKNAGSVWTQRPMTDRFQCIFPAGCSVQQTQVCSSPLAMEEELQDLLDSPRHLAKTFCPRELTIDHLLFSDTGAEYVSSPAQGAVTVENTVPYCSSFPAWGLLR